MNDISNLVDFLLNVYKLKEIKRKGWVVKVGIKDAESVASHTFGMVLLASIIYNEPLLIKNIALHDIAEAKIGDLLPEEKDKRSEDNAYEEIIKNIAEKWNLPKNLNDIFKYEKVKELDRLDMALQALYYKEKGYPKEKLMEFIEAAEKEIKSKELKEILNEIKRRFEK
jgi:Predicted hydrolases of HD superfamily